MKKKQLRGGTVADVVVTRDDRPEPEAVRLRTALHGERPRQWFRVIARLAEGGTALLAVGSSRAEVLAVARDNAVDIPADAVGLSLEEWEGGLLRGGWVSRRYDRRDLPPLPNGRKRRYQGRLLVG